MVFLVPSVSSFIWEGLGFQSINYRNYKGFYKQLLAQMNFQKNVFARLRFREKLNR